MRHQRQFNNRFQIIQMAKNPILNALDMEKTDAISQLFRTNHTNEIIDSATSLLKKH